MRPRGIWLIPFFVLASILSWMVPLHAAETQNAAAPSTVAPSSDEATQDYGEAISEEIGFDIPITINKRVEYFLKTFQNEKRRPFRNWLSRSTIYLPRMREILRENGLPEDLVYIAMVESGFNVSAYSRAHACGIWQFIEETGERYGLRVSRWMDERRNPEKATVAAAKYLKKLYDEFGCWYLAAAGYNAGENKVRKGLKAYNTADFWDMCDRNLFSRETRDYVPQIIAAAIIAKDPEKYGFTDIEYQEPIATAKVAVPPGTDLRAIALACGIETPTINLLNAELRRGCTPPEGLYRVNIPQSNLQAFNSNFSHVKKVKEIQYRQYVTSKGDTVKSISRKLGVSKKALLSCNNIKGKIKRGQILRIPYTVERFAIGPKKTGPAIKLAASAEEESRQAAGKKKVTYNVKKGDTLFSIAKRFGTTPDFLKVQNKLTARSKLQIGQVLIIKSGSKSDETEEPKESIQQTYQEAREFTLHKVQKGETIWRIARKYNVVPADIRAWNHMQDDIILPGAKLKLKVSSNS